jgi:hypothetical protein
MKTSIFLVLSFLAFTSRTMGQTPTTESIKHPALAFQARPTKHLFARGEDVVLSLLIRNESAGPVFVSRLIHDEFVDFKITGPDGKEVSWRGKGRIDSKNYSPSDFAVLGSAEKISANRTISLKNGQGFVLSKPGQYSVTAEYSLEPPEYFAPLAGDAKTPPGSFRSVNATFCIESCGPNPQK